MSIKADIIQLKRVAQHVAMALDYLNDIDAPNLKSDALWKCIQTFVAFHRTIEDMTEESLTGAQAAALDAFKRSLGEHSKAERKHVTITLALDDAKRMVDAHHAFDTADLYAALHDAIKKAQGQ